MNSEETFELLNHQPDCYGRRDRLIMGLQAIQIPLDRFLDVVDRFRAGFPLGKTTGKRWDFGDIHAVFILPNQNSILHGMGPKVVVARRVKGATTVPRRLASTGHVDNNVTIFADVVPKSAPLRS